MKDFIPTDEEFEVIFSGLEALQRDKLTRLAVEKFLDRAKNLTDEQAFTQAFSKQIEKEIATETQPEVKAIVESTIVLYAKLVKFRDAVREHRLNGAIEDLLK